MKFDNLRHVLFLFIAVLLPALSFADSQATTLFAKANADYAKGQYKDAIAAYQQVLNGGNQSAAVYFNMGNASYKDGDIPSALLYYEKAHKLSPGDDDINFNIRFANLRIVDKIDEAPEFFLANWWQAFILSFSTGTLAAMSILFVFLASLILILYFFTTSVAIKKSSFYGSLICFFLCLVTIFMAAMQVSYFNEHRQAIIFSNSVTVKSGPVDKASSLFVLHEGTKVNILETDGSWIKMRLGNGNEGWMKVSDVKEI